MISHSKRFIFIHVPKAGGTSVEWALRKYGVWQHNADQYQSIYYKHALARDLKRMMSTEFDRYYRFGLVRNPWDWVASNYAFNRGMHGVYLRHTNMTETPKVPEFAAGWTFKHWLRWWIDTCKPSQLQLMTDEQGSLLMNRVLRFEDLKGEFFGLCLRLRVLPRRLPHIYKNEARKPYPEYYDDESREWVAKHFAEEIRRFDYRF